MKVELKSDIFRELFIENYATMLIIDPKNGKIEEANNAAIKFYGYSKEQILKMNINQINILLPSEIKLKMELAKSGKQNGFIFKHRLADGTIKDVEVRSGKINYKGEKKLFSTIYDISDKIIAENKIKVQNEQLKKTQVTKDKFFSIIAHDLKSPFNAMLGFSNLLINNFTKYSDEKKLEQIKLINLNLKNTYKFLENLLLWSQSQRHKIKFNPQVINLNSFVQTIIDVHEQTAYNKGIKLINNISGNCSAWADKQMLSIIFSNLVNNAIKYTHSKGKISINCTEIKKTDKFKISISDTGVGMTQEFIEKLFESGQKISTKGTNNEKGTGMGLLISKDFIELHDSKLIVESTIGLGSTFSFTLKNADTP